jgi:hypothetical protein
VVNSQSGCEDFIDEIKQRQAPGPGAEGSRGRYPFQVHEEHEPETGPQVLADMESMGAMRLSAVEEW